MEDYNDGEWHIWHGGECPVHPDSEVHVKLCGEFADDVINLAKQMVWTQDDRRFNMWHRNGESFDILCFRVTHEAEETRILRDAEIIAAADELARALAAIRVAAGKLKSDFRTASEMIGCIIEADDALAAYAKAKETGQ